MEEVIGRRRQLLVFLTVAYACFVAFVCLMPQPDLGRIETPGIQHIGPFVVLLRPFNTLWALGNITSFHQFCWVVVQNLLNVFLLYPLTLGLLLLFPRYRSIAAAVKFGFLCSLFIESSQLLLDGLFNFNRVFELDDLWTNTLGAVLAYLTYRYRHQWLKRLLNWCKKDGGNK